jgi:hypothetical protein
MSCVRWLAWGLAICGVGAVGQTGHPAAIASISVCSPAGTGGAGSCPGGSFDTHQIVLAPDGSGNAVNSYGGLSGIADQHQSIFGPRTLQNNSDYVFFVGSNSKLNGTQGLVALTGGAGPNQNGQWTMDFASLDGYDSYTTGFGQIFLPPVGITCPASADGTFDLNYAAPGGVVADPSSSAGNLLMLYSAGNSCVGTTGAGTGNTYGSVGVATSKDYGHTWPAYHAKTGFTFVPLPGENATQGPGAGLGGLGSGVCVGNDCATAPAASYGRYAVLTPSVSLSSAMGKGVLAGSMGDSQVSAFVDDASASPGQYLYAVYNYTPGTGAAADAKAPNNVLGIARAKLNAGIATLIFSKWNGGLFGSAGLGGYDSTILPAGTFQTCGAASQLAHGASISYVDETQQYLLTFVCESPGDPAAGMVASTRGAAWFYSTNYDLNDQNGWTTPKEIAGSWNTFDTSGGCNSYKGYYPSWMSLGSKPGHLSASGYVFYLWGCEASNAGPARKYSSRAFTILTTAQLPNISLVANAEGENPVIAPNTWVEIKGANLAPPNSTRIWQSSDFVNGQMPTSLSGVSATVNGKAAYIYYISPTQVNILTPPDTLSGPVTVQVTNNGMTSAAYTVATRAESPSFFVINGGPYVAALHANGALIGPSSLYPGVTTPAAPGETILLYANGFGPTNQTVTSGASQQGGQLLSTPAVTIGGKAATVLFDGLISPGLYQLNVTVPTTVGTGNQAIVATYLGLTTQAGTLITVQP